MVLRPPRAAFHALDLILRDGDLSSSAFILGNSLSSPMAMSSSFLRSLLGHKPAELCSSRKDLALTGRLQGCRPRRSSASCVGPRVDSTEKVPDNSVADSCGGFVMTSPPEAGLGVCHDRVPNILTKTGITSRDADDRYSWSEPDIMSVTPSSWLFVRTGRRNRSHANKTASTPR
jgi:hypothetical protein